MNHHYCLSGYKRTKTQHISYMESLWVWWYLLLTNQSYTILSSFFQMWTCSSLFMLTQAWNSLIILINSYVHFNCKGSPISLRKFYVYLFIYHSTEYNCFYCQHLFKMKNMQHARRNKVIHMKGQDLIRKIANALIDNLSRALRLTPLEQWKSSCVANDLSWLYLMIMKYLMAQ